MRTITVELFPPVTADTYRRVAKAVSAVVWVAEGLHGAGARVVVDGDEDAEAINEETREDAVHGPTV